MPILLQSIPEKLKMPFNENATDEDINYDSDCIFFCLIRCDI